VERYKGAGRRRVPTRGAGTAGAAEAGAATGTVGVGSEGANMDRTEAAALGRPDGAEWWDGKRGGGTGSTFSDDPIHVVEEGEARCHVADRASSRDWQVALPCRTQFRVYL